jgi:hypothetical protein
MRARRSTQSSFASGDDNKQQQEGGGRQRSDCQPQIDREDLIRLNLPKRKGPSATVTDATPRACASVSPAFRIWKTA